MAASGPRLQQAAALLAALDAGDDAAARRALGALGYRGEQDLYQRIGALARQVHNAIGEIEGDAMPMSLADATLPDPRERLRLVIDKTEQASHDTLDLIESLAPVPARILVGANRLGAQNSEESTDPLADYLDALRVDADLIAAGLTAITEAQELQDATGQISRRAVALIEDVERQLVEIVQLAGDAGLDGADRDAAPAPQAAGRGGQHEVALVLASLGF